MGSASTKSDGGATPCLAYTRERGETADHQEQGRWLGNWFQADTVQQREGRETGRRTQRQELEHFVRCSDGCRCRENFVFSSNQDQSTFTLCIDEEFAGCNQEGRGEHLFDADGNRTQHLENVLRFVNDYQGQFRRTQLFCKKLQELDLLEPMQAQFTVGAGQQLRLAGFMAVNRERLKNLPDDQITALFKTDELELIYLHLQSMKNFNAMEEPTAAHVADQKTEEENKAADESVPPAKEGLH